jgi:hypothetical protein
MPIDPDLLRAHADRIRASGILGRSSLMQRLFDFLLECSLNDKAPKEIEVAMDAFGKGADFDVSQDAMVRVYVHKLRRKLEDFYASGGADEPARLSIPKGEYRFVIESVQPPAAEQALTAAAAATTPAPAPSALASNAETRSSTRRWIAIALIASLLVNAALLLTAYRRPPEPRDELASVRQSAIWAPILKDDRPIFLVIGDYYIFGETDDTMEVKRLVREFGINSSQDLEQYLKLHPEDAERYMDLELAYLPTAAAYALRDVMPVLSSVNKRIRIVTMSQLNPAVIKSADIIYVGYLSGLGRLGDLAFRSSRLSVGETYDEIVDHETGKRYVSQAGAPYRGETQVHDYGYFATFAGPEGNRIMIVAGTRDVAAMHMSETITAQRTLDTLVSSAKSMPSFEALYEVYGMDRMNLDGRLLLTSPLDSERIWTGTAAAAR